MDCFDTRIWLGFFFLEYNTFLHLLYTGGGASLYWGFPLLFRSGVMALSFLLSFVLSSSLSSSSFPSCTYRAVSPTDQVSTLYRGTFLLHHQPLLHLLTYSLTCSLVNTKLQPTIPIPISINTTSPPFPFSLPLSPRPIPPFPSPFLFLPHHLPHHLPLLYIYIFTPPCSPCSPNHPHPHPHPHSITSFLLTLGLACSSLSVRTSLGFGFMVWGYSAEDVGGRGGEGGRC